jgi:hypothetical protein
MTSFCDGLHAVTKCILFQNNVRLAAVPYKIRSSVPLDVFQQFVSALNGNSVTITEANLFGLLLLCEEFGFEALSSRLLQFKQSTKPKRNEGTETRERITALEERTAALEKQGQQRDSDFEVLQGIVARFIENKGCNSLDSVIILDFPQFFGLIRGRHFKILWRGSRDGFTVKDFHRQCDSHTNTLIVILDTKGNIFGGFTPVEWESRVWNKKVGKDNNIEFIT